MAKILLVEDDKQIASYLGELLCDEGFAVTQAGSKAEAKNKLLENQFDLVLLGHRRGNPRPFNDRDESALFTLIC